MSEHTVVYEWNAHQEDVYLAALADDAHKWLRGALLQIVDAGTFHTSIYELKEMASAALTQEASDGK